MRPFSAAFEAKHVAGLSAAGEVRAGITVAALRAGDELGVE